VYRYAPQPSNWNIGVAKSILNSGNAYVLGSIVKSDEKLILG